MGVAIPRQRQPALDPDDEAELIRLLTLLRVRGGQVPNMPEAVWRAYARLAPALAVEILLSSPEGGDVLLTWRDDQDWRGWHLPGGFVGMGEPVEAAAVRVAQAEIGLAVDVIRLAGSDAWPDHPYAAAVSVLCECQALAGLDGRRDGTLFRTRPEPMVPRHGVYVDRYLATAGRVGQVEP